MKPKLLLLLLLAFNFSFAQKKTVAKADPFAGLDTAFQRVLKDRKAAGFAVAVVSKDKVLYVKGFGYRDYENKLPVTPTTQFAIGSCTKAFTSALMGLLEKFTSPLLLATHMSSPQLLMRLISLEGSP